MAPQANGQLPAFDALDEVVRQVMEHEQIPGVAVGILNDGQIQARGYGVISLVTGYPTREDTLFQVGSNTKVFTCTAIMRLVDQGKVGLDAPVKQYIPDLQLADERALEQITVRHLLTHTSGLEGDRFEDTGFGDDALAKFVGMAYTWAQETDPSAYWSYCNTGWALAGQIVANIAGKPYEQAIKELVFEPLGLERSFFFAHECVMYSVAAGHNQYPGQDEPHVAIPWQLPRASNPAGGIIAGARDLLTFCAFHMGDGRVGDAQVLTPESVAAMQTTQTTIHEGSDWGLGWHLETIDGARVIRHGGVTNGHITMMSAIPAQRFAIAILTNSSKGQKVIKAVEEWAFKTYCDVTVSKPAPVTLAPEQLERLAGVYTQTTGKTTIAVEDDHLVATAIFTHPLTREEIAMPAEKLTPIAEWEVMSDDGDRVQFIRGDGDRPRYMRMGRLARRQA